MTRATLSRFAVAVALGILATMLSVVDVQAGGRSAPNVHATRIGHPIWKPVDFHLFSAPVGTAGSGYAEFGETMSALLPPPDHQSHPNLGTGPGAPHAPPYDDEFDESVDALGYRESDKFSTAEWSDGQGVWLVWMNVPARGTTGSSPDFASGRIIPNTLFPIHVVATNERNGKPYSVAGEFDVPALDGNLDPPFAVDGHSHFPIFIADNADFGPPGVGPRGQYRFEIVMIDRSGSGWRIHAHFAVGR